MVDALVKVPYVLQRRLGEMKNQAKNQDDTDHRIFKIGENTWKSSREISWRAITQTPGKDKFANTTVINL